MKIAVASLGTVPEAWVGTKKGIGSQFLVFDLDTMDYIIVGVPPRLEVSERARLEAIRALGRLGVSVVITGHIEDVCRRALRGLGIEVIDGVEGTTVGEAVEMYKTTGLTGPDAPRRLTARVAIASRGPGLDAILETSFDTCASFVVVDPQTMECEALTTDQVGATREATMARIQVVVKSGVRALISPKITPECCMALQALAVMAYHAPEGISVREAVELYEQGELEPPVSYLLNLVQ